MNNWTEIVNCHAVMVVSAVRRILGNNHDVEDVVQEVFLEAYQVSQRNEIQNWPGFLRLMASRRAIDRLRKHRIQPLSMSTAEAGEVADTFSQPHQNAVADELALRLRNAIALLTQTQAEIFAMRCFEEMTYEQIAYALGISSNAVGLALHKARSRLQVLFADENTDGDLS